MKKLFTIATIMLLFTSCSGSNKHGECVGFDSKDRDPKLEYRLSVRNTFWSVVGIETIIAPILYATDYAYCPIGPKGSKK